MKILRHCSSSSLSAKVDSTHRASLTTYKVSRAAPWMQTTTVSMKNASKGWQDFITCLGQSTRNWSELQKSPGMARQSKIC